MTLQTLDSTDFADSLTSFPQPYSEYAELDSSTSPLFNLPSVLVPPEIIELDGLSTSVGEDSQAKKDDWPEYFQRLFDAGVRIAPYSLSTVLTHYFGRLLLIPQHYLATLSGLRCWILLTYSKLTEKNASASLWSTQNGLYQEHSSLNLDHKSS